MFERKIIAAAAVLFMGASLATDVLAYPTTARSGTSTVTGVYRPLVLNLDVVEEVPLSIADCEGVCSSRVSYVEAYGGPADSWYEPAYVEVSLFLTGTYSTFGDSIPVGGSSVTGNAGYWEYSFFARDGVADRTITASQISPTEFEILISAGVAGTRAGELYYLGGGSFTGVPAADTPLTWEDKEVLYPGSELGSDWFQYTATLAGAVMRITSSNASGSDFVLAFDQNQVIQHLGPFGSPLDVERTNTGCLVNGVDDEDGTKPCGDVTLLASAAATSVPEPASLALVGLGLVGVAMARRQRRSQLRGD